MKNLVLWLLTSLSIFSCKKDNPSMASATLNGKEWNAESRSIISTNPDYIEYRFDIRDKEGVSRQTLVFSRVIKSTGVFKIRQYDSEFLEESCLSIYYTSIADGDVTGDSYRLWEEEANFLEITEFDEQTGDVRGKFNVKLGRTAKDPNSTLPEILRITDGSFFVNILE